MNLADLSWTRIRALIESAQPVFALLPCGAVEAHGPHLPLSTDVIISEGMAHRAVPMLKAHNIAAVILPSIAYAPAQYAAAFPGTVTISAASAKAVLIDIAAALKAQGFAGLALVNSHFDPANVAMLRETAAEIRASGLPVAFPDFTRRALAATLTEEFVSGACHAGQFETSLVLADRPELVDEAARLDLPENPHSLVAAFAAGAKTFEDACGPQAYFGAPQSATAAEGIRTFSIMAEAVVQRIRDALNDTRR